MNKEHRLSNLIKAIGPGFLFAGAAIGGSHLVQSTRAGASYGFELVLLVILVNLFKMPFFEYGKRYLAATGKNLIYGYAQYGKWAVGMFFGLSLISSIANIAGVTIVSAGLLSFLLQLLFNINAGVDLLSAIIMVLSIVIIAGGKYSVLDKIIKTLIIILAISTIIALVLALFKGQQASPDFISPEMLNAVGIGFMISLMGWMPAPIEASVWISVWGDERSNQTGYKPTMNEHKIDFYIGFIGTGLLALVFLALGAYVMYGTGEQFAASGVGFSSQLVKLYSDTIGDWSAPIISIVAFVTMASTVLTVIDAYPKTLVISASYLFKRIKTNNISILILTVTLSFLALLIIFRFTNHMKNLIDLATIISFLTATVFAYLNFIVVIGIDFPQEHRPGIFMRVLSVMGIIFFAGFSIIFVLTRLGIIFS
jgi:Mn2+/Fe2+ NRAMP family transporter